MSINKNIHAVAVSLDNTLLNNKYGSSLERQLRYANELGNYSLVILNTGKKYKPKRIKGLRLIPTNSHNRLFFITDAIRIILSLNQKMHINVITAQDPYITGLIAVLTKKILRTPCNIQIHSEDMFSSFWKNRTLTNKLLLLLAKFNLPQADSIRYLTKKQLLTLRTLSSKITNRTYQAPVYVDSKFYSNKPKANKISKFIYVARLSWEKNHPLLLRVFANLSKRHNNISLTLVGGGPEEQRLKRLSQNLKLKNVLFTGYLTKSEVKKQLHKHQMFVSTGLYEGWGMAIQEAVEAGLPVVISNTGAAGELIKHKKTGLVFKIDNLSDLTKQLTFAINNPHTLHKYARAAVKLLRKRYSQEKVINTWVKCLSQTARIGTHKSPLPKNYL